ncbi:MAG: PDZ domain-containing protein [Chthoniobacteraceae bacterium]
MKLPAFLVFLAVFVFRAVAEDSLDARLMRMPAVSEKQIAFVYAGDIWVAPKEGGTAIRLSSPAGEEMFPRFSPDGREIAFTANYDGADSIYVMPVSGGEPRRVTFHGAGDRMVCWWPDGKSIVFGSKRESFTDRAGQFFKVNAQAGLPEKLPIPYGEFGAISPDGKTFAYTMTDTDRASWKRYRGGMAPDVWLFHLDTGTAENITLDDACDSQPMWAGNGRVYFLSDRGEKKRANLWCYEVGEKKLRQVTNFTGYDVRYPSIGPKEIVFENGGALFLLDLATEQARQVKIEVITDKATLRPRVQNVGGLVRNGTISPTGKRVLFESRGEIFSVPAENGVIRNFTETPGIAERYPAWSPDGKRIAYFSDRSGEYELTLRSADGAGDEQQITTLGAGWRYSPHWSPDSKKIVFTDSAMRIWLTDIETKQTVAIDKEMWLYHGELENFSFSWSPDSRWLAYAGDTENRQQGIVIYDTKERKRRPVTSAFYDDDMPVFDPNGNYLYYRSKRNFTQHRSEFDNTWAYLNSHTIICVPLRKDMSSPLAPKNDEEPMKKDEAKKETPNEAPKSTDPAKKPEDSKKGELKPDDSKPIPQPPNRTTIVQTKNGPVKMMAGTAQPQRPTDVKIDLDGFEDRAIVLPVGSGRIDQLSALPGKVLFRWPPRAGSNNRTSPLSYYDVDARAERMVLDDIGGYEVSADGHKLLVAKGGSWFVTPAAEGAKADRPLPTNSIETTVDPVAEWHQLFDDAWRIERDFFYDPYLHLVKWQEMRERYHSMLSGCATRHDVNYVLGELLGELNSSHTYRSGGDIPETPKRRTGYLGCDYSLEQGAYRIKRIFDVAPWDTGVRSPLRGPGVPVKEGDFLLAVNGRKLDTKVEPAAVFSGLAEKTVVLTVNDKPVLEGAREVILHTLGSESALRQAAWINQNRLRVEAATGGRCGYIYVKNTGDEGQTELFRQWRGQTQKDALIIDERWNSGGHIPDRFIEVLNRPTTNYYAVRDGRDWSSPMVSTDGPKVMLANGWSGSGGDCFPFLFQQKKLGPVIGTRTWGGLIGMTGSPQLTDGGHVTVPTFAIYDTNGKWIIEGTGVKPDIEVLDDPAAIAKGTDPQLERGIKEIVDQLAKNPPHRPAKPGYTDRSR